MQILGYAKGNAKTEPPAAKNPAAVALGRKGGIARAAAMPAKNRKEAYQDRSTGR
jgi:hypothetical protein